MLVRHLTHALSGHVRRLGQQGLPVPPEVGALTEYFLRVARSRQEPPMAAGIPHNRQSAPCQIGFW